MPVSLILSLLLFFSVPFALKAQDATESKLPQQDGNSKHHEVTPAHLIS
jgi:hypothetical protein